jgi:hypothetical protein
LCPNTDPAFGLVELCDQFTYTECISYSDFFRQSNSGQDCHSIIKCERDRNVHEQCFQNS